MLQFIFEIPALAQFLLIILAVCLLGVGAALLGEKVLAGSTQRVRRRLQLIYQRFGGMVSFLLALVVFFASKPILRQLDPTTSPFDMGWAQTILISTMRLLVFHGLTHIFLNRLYWAPVSRYLVKNFKLDFFRLSPWQKIWVSLAVFFGFLQAFIQLTH